MFLETLCRNGLGWRICSVRNSSLFVDATLNKERASRPGLEDQVASTTYCNPNLIILNSKP